jgi:hypothetical protein
MVISTIGVFVNCVVIVGVLGHGAGADYAAVRPGAGQEKFPRTRSGRSGSGHGHRYASHHSFPDPDLPGINNLIYKKYNSIVHFLPVL